MSAGTTLVRSPALAAWTVAIPDGVQAQLVAVIVHVTWLALSILVFRATARGMLIEGDGSAAQGVFVIGALFSALAALVCFLRVGASLATLLGGLLTR